MKNLKRYRREVRTLTPSHYNMEMASFCVEETSTPFFHRAETIATNETREGGM